MITKLLIIILLVVLIYKLTKSDFNFMATRVSKYDLIRGNVFYVPFQTQEEFASNIAFFSSKGFEYVPEYSSQNQLCFRIPVRK